MSAVYADGGAQAEAAKRAVYKAKNANNQRTYRIRCGATDPALHDGFVIKYSTSRQAGLEQHGDGGGTGRRGAAPTSTKVGMCRTAPLEPQTCELRKRGLRERDLQRRISRATIFQTTLLGRSGPLLTYDEFCPANCLGQSCDEVELHLRTKCDRGSSRRPTFTTSKMRTPTLRVEARFSSLEATSSSRRRRVAPSSTGPAWKAGAKTPAVDTASSRLSSTALCQAAERARYVLPRLWSSCLSWCLCWCGGGLR